MSATDYAAEKTHVLVENGRRFPLLLACDHASNHIPAHLENLGVPADLLREHIAWDIGAGLVARELGRLLEVPVVLATHSRLVVDCNRNLDDPTAFPAVSDGIAVPGNEELDMLEREARANAFYWPYHHAVRDQLRALEDLAAAPALIAIHSFTPEMDAEQRPWCISALYDKDDRIALPFMENLRQQGSDIVVGDNVPYSGKHPADFTLDHHAEAEGLAHLGVEIRQDLIDTPAGVEQWSQVLAEALLPVLSDDSLYTHRAGSL